MNRVPEKALARAAGAWYDEVLLGHFKDLGVALLPLLVPPGQRVNASWNGGGIEVLHNLVRGWMACIWCSLRLLVKGCVEWFLLNDECVTSFNLLAKDCYDDESPPSLGYSV